MIPRRSFALGLFAFVLSGADLKSTFDALKQGKALTAEEALGLEQRVTKNPKDVDTRVCLLAYYAGRTTDSDLDSVKAVRAKHILWLIENQPKASVFDVATRVFAISADGDALSDSVAFQRGRELWLKQIERRKKDMEIKKNAATWLEFGDRELTERLLQEAGENRWLGQVYANAMLGLAARDYGSSEPVIVSDEVRTSAFAQHAREILERSNDAALLGGAGWAFAMHGGNLYADGKLDWDYSQTARDVLERAGKLDPKNMDWFAADPQLPARGERPAQTLRIGGNVMSAKLARQVTPQYPINARGALGTVRMNALVGTTGAIEKLVVLDGPNALRDASLTAVKQWVYEPTLLNGKPVKVITLIDVHYQ